MRHPTEGPVLDRYDVYDLASLAGGPHHVVDTALVALAERGQVRAGETGELSRSDTRGRCPVEAAVLEAIGPRPRRSAGTIRWKLAQDPRVTEIGDRLAAEGLVTGRSRRLLTGGRPRPVLTPTGRDLLRRARAVPPIDHVAPGTSAMVVALRGLGAMADAGLRRALFEPPAVARPARVRDRRASVPTVPSWGVWAGGGDGGAGWGGGWGGDGGGCGDGGGGGGGGGGSC